MSGFGIYKALGAELFGLTGVEHLLYGRGLDAECVFSPMLNFLPCFR